jgi:hypothetical protein
MITEAFVVVDDAPRVSATFFCDTTHHSILAVYLHIYGGWPNLHVSFADNNRRLHVLIKLK